MSRTTKDKRWELRFPEDMYENRYENTLERKGAKRKKRKEVDTEYHWMSTPSWWTNLFMNRPLRRLARMWEKKVVKVEDLEEVDKPNNSKKPHKYYW